MHMEECGQPGLQEGAALLALVVILTVASTYALLAALNRQSAELYRAARTRESLESARRGLLDYAMNYPDLRGNSEKGPGFLPCPDRSNDGNPESNCAASTGTVLGRLPFRILGLGDLRDGSGERLWYAVSPDFRNTRSNSAVINSDTPGQLRFDASDDVVAVIIAPGGPLAHQAARPGNRPRDYLDCNNATGLANGFSSHCVAVGIPGCDPGDGDACFNDIAIPLTRRELMAEVELRVTGEARQALERYRHQTGVWPRLAAFADPHAGPRWIEGVHSGPGGAPWVHDSRQDFRARGVSVGDRVWNLDDGATGTITAVSQHDLTVGSGMRLGDENDFDAGDRYIVESSQPATTFSGTAAYGSGTRKLVDPAQNFIAAGIVPGDVVDNLRAGIGGAVVAVEKTRLSFSMTGQDTALWFWPGDGYRVRGNFGAASTDAAALLADMDADFIRMGVRKDDLVFNVSDGSFGRVTRVGDNGHELETGELRFGASNRFSRGDQYRVSRLRPLQAIREGGLPLQLPGEVFETGFSFEWSLPVVDHNIVNVEPDGNAPAYAIGLSTRIQSSAASGPVRVDATDGQCRWISREFAECWGRFTDTEFLSGRVDAILGDGVKTIVDRRLDFPASGVKPGDRLLNPDRGTEGLVYAALPASPHAVQVVSLAGQPEFSAASGDRIRIRVSTGEYPGRVDVADIASSAACTAGADLSFLQPGDTVINESDSGAMARVTGKYTYAGMYCFVYGDLQGGLSSRFTNGQTYTLRYGFVDRRRYILSVRMHGEAVVSTDHQARLRTVCIGYADGCVDGPAAVPLQGDGGRPVVTVTDFDASGNRTGRADVTIPVTGPAAGGSMRLSRIDYSLTAEGGDVPGWFVKNRWYQYIYVGYSAAHAPIPGSGCADGTSCLTVVTRAARNRIRRDASLVVLAAGPALATQDRSKGSLDTYLEDENAMYDDDRFATGSPAEDFNDQGSVTTR